MWGSKHLVMQLNQVYLLELTNLGCVQGDVKAWTRRRYRRPTHCCCCCCCYCCCCHSVVAAAVDHAAVADSSETLSAEAVADQEAHVAAAVGACWTLRSLRRLRQLPSPGPRIGFRLPLCPGSGVGGGDSARKVHSLKFTFLSMRGD